jgi:glycosyltransferase involved in cell wall biosynthesis
MTPEMQINVGSKPEPAPPNSSKILFLGANTPWVYALAEALARGGYNVSAIAPYDARNFRRLHPQWPLREPPSGLQREFWVYPPGYVGTLSNAFAPFLRARLKRAAAKLESADNRCQSPWVIAPYPWFANALRYVPDNRLVYYNLDDYVLYQPERAASILRQESELVRRSALTLCLSLTQVDSLRKQYPNRAGSIRHFPLGVGDCCINPNPTSHPSNRIVGYIGNLIDRVDWRLVASVAHKLPDVEFHFVGGLEGFGGGGVVPNWKEERARALALPNLKRIGPIPQDQVAAYYRNFALNWIPYDTRHAFNKAACPTKIMDGLASGRPLLSTDIPECRLYPGLIEIASSVDEAVASIGRMLAGTTTQSGEQSSKLQVEVVRNKHTWTKRAELLSKWLTSELLN